MFSPWNRDIAFNEFYRENKGTIDANAGVALWASSPGQPRPRLRRQDHDHRDGQPDGLSCPPRQGNPCARSSPPRGWRYLPDLPGAEPHLSLGYSVVSPVFIADQLKAVRASQETVANERDVPDLEFGELSGEFDIDKKDLWRGTIEPASPAESWFVSATAAYWRLLDGPPRR